MNEGGHSDDSHSQKHEVLGHRHKLGSVTNTNYTSYSYVYGLTIKQCDVYLGMSYDLVEGEVCNSRTIKQQMY